MNTIKARLFIRPRSRFFQCAVRVKIGDSSGEVSRASTRTENGAAALDFAHSYARTVARKNGLPAASCTFHVSGKIPRRKARRRSTKGGQRHFNFSPTNKTKNQKK